MTRLSQTARLDKDTLNKLAAVYRNTSLPPALRQAKPRALMTALKLADGDVHRLGVDEDGSVFVYNYRVW